MIILYIRGGLGNQMSQAAYSWILAKRTGDRACLDRSSYETYKIRNFALDRMKIRAELPDVGTSVSPAVMKKLRMTRFLYHVFQKAVTKFTGETGRGIFTFLARHGYYYNFDSTWYGFPEAKASVKVKDVYGYFLAEKYFHDDREALMDLFTPTAEPEGREREYLDRITACEAAAISLRLQDDYAKNAMAHVCDEAYFRAGIAYLREKVPGVKFFIFADDISRAKALDLGIDAEYIEGMTDVQGMRLMNHCRHYIISNSSFSWWGAYLSRNEDRIIVAPKRWMNNPKNDYHDKYYGNMVRM